MTSILRVLHNYFADMGFDEIRRRGAQNDKALRMAKTLLHELCKHAVRRPACAHAPCLTPPCGLCATHCPAPSPLTRPV